MKYSVIRVPSSRDARIPSLAYQSFFFRFLGAALRQRRVIRNGQISPINSSRALPRVHRFRARFKESPRVFTKVDITRLDCSCGQSLSKFSPFTEGTQVRPWSLYSRIELHKPRKLRIAKFSFRGFALSFSFSLSLPPDCIFYIHSFAQQE